MLVIFGANGMTGIEVLREAKLRGIPVRPIARNDHDTHRLEDLVEVNEIYFADADHKESIKAALQGATAVISCLDSRTAGYGSPIYSPEASANIIEVAASMNIKKMLHLSVMGAYRWSPNPLNKRSFHLDLLVRRLRVPWTMLRISCYHDELINSHVRPPDGLAVHPIRPASRYAPVSRRDTARVICNILPDLIPNRTWLLGGPKVYSGKELQNTFAPYITQHKGSKTDYGSLPHGDFSVATETTEIMVGWIPTETLEWALDPQKYRIEQTSPFWNRPDPEKHRTDQGVNEGILLKINADTRFAIHQGLSDDAHRIGIDTTQFYLDFADSHFDQSQVPVLPHKSPLYPIQQIHIMSETTKLYTGNMNIIYDDLADALHIWWTDMQNPLTIPNEIWNQIDLGVRRRLHRHPIWSQSEKVRQFTASKHERIQV